MKNYLACLLPAAALSAQGAVGPSTITALQNTVTLSATALQVIAVKSFSAIQLPNDPPGVFYVGITALGLPAARGGAGNNDLLTGRYDSVQSTFTEDLFAAGLNTAGNEFCMSLHASGLYAVTDRNGGGTTIGIARRPDLNSPFTYVGDITTLPANPFYDPAIATVDGQLRLVYTEGHAIVMRTLDINTLQVGPPQPLASSRSLSGYPSSVQPICDSRGEMIGFTYSDDWPNQSDAFVALDLDPATPGQIQLDVAVSLYNGCLFGADYYAPGYASPTLVAQHLICTGGRAAIGSTMEIAAYAPLSVTSWSSWLVLSTAYTPPTIVLGVRGLLGVAPPPLALPFGAHSAGSGRAGMTIPVPNDPQLSGAVIPAQLVSVRAAATAQFGNTCALTIR